MSKKDIMPLEIEVALNEEGRLRHALCEVTAAGSGPYRIAQDIFTVGKVYKTVGLSKKFYDDGSNVSIYYLFDDKGTLRETAIQYWRKVQASDPVDKNGLLTNEATPGHRV